MIARRTVHLAVALFPSLAGGTGKTLAPTPPGVLSICLGAGTWNIEESCHDL